MVERRRSPSQSLPGSYEDRLRELEEEATVGLTLGITTNLTENVCTWWVGSIRQRLLTFRYPTSHSFSHIVASERRLSGTSLTYSGFPSHLLLQFCFQATVYGAHVLRPVERLLLGTHRSKAFYRRWKGTLDTAFRISLELLFYPFSYYLYLQRIGLAPARPIIPPLKSFVPLSGSSPLLPVSSHYSALASSADFFKALATSPFVWVCLGHFFERWVEAIIHAPIETTVIRPTNPDIISPDQGDKERAIAILGLRKKSPRFVRDGIVWLLEFMGWGDATQSKRLRSNSVGSRTHDHQESNGIEAGERHARNINSFDIPSVSRNALAVSETNVPGTITVPLSSLSEVLPDSQPASPILSPTTSQASHNDGDPRIRITTRGDLVEMEVRLPPHVLSTHTEVAASGPPTPVQRDIASPLPVRSSGMLPYHRVTQLSTEPSSMIATIVKAQVVSLVTLPLKTVVLRLVASHYLVGRQEHATSRSFYSAIALPREFDLSSFGALLSRLALCNMFELAIDLGLWGCQYLTVSYLGISTFGWGTL